jgi:hypothetical protein
MSDVADTGSNPAGSEAQVSDAGQSSPAPAPSQGDQGQQQQEAVPSSREALAKAMTAVAGQQQDGQQQQQPTVKEENRDPLTGKFTPKAKAPVAGQPQDQQQQQATDPQAPKPVTPPTRFTKAAQEAWAQTPEPVRVEVERAITELTQGIEKYRQGAEAFEPLRPYHELAQQYGVEMKDALANYVELDHMWSQNAVQAFFLTCQKTNVNPQTLIQEVVNAITGQPQQADPRDHVIAELQNRLAQIEGNVGQVRQTFEQQQFNQVYNANLQQVQSFMADKPYFNDLIPSMTEMVQKGFATNLSDAYEKAVRLNPEISAKIEADKAVRTANNRQPGSNPKANLSITGSPSSAGSTLAAKPAGSNREAVQRAIAQVGGF